MNFRSTMKFQLKTKPGLQKPKLELLMQPARTFEEALVDLMKVNIEIREVRSYLRNKFCGDNK